MKISFSKSNRGNVLLIALLFGATIGLVLGSYLMLVSSRHEIVARSQAWNAAMAVTEAGIEEGMTHLNDDRANLIANNWSGNSVGGQVVYSKHRGGLPDGSYFDTQIANVTPTSATLTSTGSVRAPLTSTDYISRIVQVIATNPMSVFTRTVATTATNGTAITISGLLTVVDSYNSSLGSYSVTNSGTNGGMVTDSRSTKAIILQGGAKLYGMADTGVGGTVYTSGGSTVSGPISDDMNVFFASNPPPSLSGPLPVPSNSSGPAYLYGGTSYVGTTFTSGNNTQPLIVTGTGNAVLYLTAANNCLTVGGSGYIEIKPGASLTLYLGGTASIQGGGVVNDNGLPENLSIIGLSGCTSLTISGGSAFYGTVNAPQAAFTLSGGSAAYGAFIIKTFNDSGGSSLHYDTALALGNGNYVPTSWKEL